MLKGNDATLFAVFKPFIFVVVCLLLFFFLNHCKELMCLSILTVGAFQSGGGCIVTDMMDDEMNHCYYFGTVNETQ